MNPTNLNVLNLVDDKLEDKKPKQIILILV